ncbi:hypothetical protein ACFVIL_29300 [Streptomyces sp. NPDC127159]|uniref:hypothetical protein n=1 Tax=unclassified Streptomyces TaxID=2593676 RepID=UPI003625D297
MTGRPTRRSPGTHTVPGSGVHAALINNAYGLSIREVKAEIRRLTARGWQTWEISLRFARTRKDTNE